MTSKARLAKIEKGLSPREIVLAWLDDSRRRFGAFRAWLEWAALTPGESPYYKLPKAAMDAVATRRKGRGDDPRRAQEDAMLNTVFLVGLVVHCSQQLGEKLSECELEAALCARSLQVLLLRDVLGEAAADPAAAVAAADLTKGENGVGGPPAGRGETDIAAVRSAIIRLLGIVYLCRSVVRAIQRNYFAGHEILFRDTANRLATAISIAETLADEYNDFIRCRPQPQKGEPPQTWPSGEVAERPVAGMIDLAEARALARAQVRAEVTFAATMAKAEALLQMGRRDKAADIALRAVGNGTGEGRARRA